VRNKRLIVLFSILLSLTVVVIFGSIVFSVSVVTTSGHNINVYDEGQQLSDRVIEAANVRRRSIFLLNDDRIISDIEEAVPQVQVVNIERLFPNRVLIHFVKLYNYFRVYRDGNYYSLRASGRITYINEEADRNFIDVFGAVSFGDLAVGDYMFNRATNEFLIEVATSLERLGAGTSAASNLIEFINISYSNNNVYIGMRGGGIIRIIYANENFFDKLRMGLSVFVSQYLGRGDIISTTGAHAFVARPGDYEQLRQRLTS